MNVERKNQSKDFSNMMEFVGLGVLFIFVSYLFIAEMNMPKKCIPDDNAQLSARCS